ncbi:MAG: response regulator [Candidatus Jordarchaeum sp.]|uniref:response regulator n=1 Tax=Candidatus Jordarchaeum sp. TaxID=2823881 RepID=UPI004049FFAF
MRIVIADDSEIVRSRLIEMLEGIKGIEVVAQAKDSREAIDAIRTYHPDLVIMDIRMPGNDGIVAIETIRKTKRNKPKIIVFTNYPYLQYRKKCMDAGADFFFYKALEFEKLVELIKELAQKN